MKVKTIKAIVRLAVVLFTSYFFMQSNCLAELKQKTSNVPKETLSGEWVFRGMQKGFTTIKGRFEIMENQDRLTGKCSNSIIGMNKDKEDILKIALPNNIEGNYIGDYKVKFQVRDKANNSTLVFQGFISKNKSRMDGQVIQTFETKGPIYQMSFQQGASSPQKVGENKYSVKYDFAAIKVRTKSQKK